MNAIRLSNEDAAALDLLLDRSPAATGQTSPVYVPSRGPDRQRVQSAQKFLGLLHLMPVGEPPLDLLSRTLSHINGSADASAHVGSMLTHSSQPHA